MTRRTPRRGRWPGRACRPGAPGSGRCRTSPAPIAPSGSGEVIRECPRTRSKIPNELIGAGPTACLSTVAASRPRRPGRRAGAGSRRTHHPCPWLSFAAALSVASSGREVEARSAWCRRLGSCRAAPASCSPRWPGRPRRRGAAGRGPAFGVEQGGEQVQAVHVRVAAADALQGIAQRFLALARELVVSHRPTSFLCYRLPAVRPVVRTGTRAPPPVLVRSRAASRAAMALVDSSSARSWPTSACISATSAGCAATPFQLENSLDAGKVYLVSCDRR